MSKKYDQVKEFISSKGDILLSSEYTRESEILDIKCGKCGKCGEEYKISFKNFKRRRIEGCYHAVTAGKRLNYIEIKKIIESQSGYILLSSEYKDYGSLLDIKCGKCGEEYKQNLDNFKRGHYHPFCGRDNTDKRPQGWIDKKKIYIDKICVQCNKIFQVDKGRDKQFLCSVDCRKLFEKEKAKNGHFKQIGRMGGIVSAKIQDRRSKNEIYFSELCEHEFEEVLANEGLFEGWDADIIIRSLKIAVMWNGQWHYLKVRSNHNVDAVHKRDEEKIKAIKRCGYIPYIIVDMGKYDKVFVERQFELLKNNIKSGKIHNEDYTLDHFKTINLIENFGNTAKSVQQILDTSNQVNTQDLNFSTYDQISGNVIKSDIKPKLLIITPIKFELPPTPIVKTESKIFLPEIIPVYLEPLSLNNK